MTMQAASNRPQFEPTYLKRRLSRPEQRTWFLTLQRKLCEAFGDSFTPRMSPGVTIAAVKDVSVSRAGSTACSNGLVRREIVNHLPTGHGEATEARVLWPSPIRNHWRTHLALSLSSEQIEQEIAITKEIISGLGAQAVGSYKTGPHLSLGTFKPDFAIPSEAYQIVNEHRPEVIALMPVKVLQRDCLAKVS